MNNEVTLANAEWCRKQAAKYLKLATAIEEILNGTGISSLVKEDVRQTPLFQGNNPTPSFDQVQKEAAKGGRVKNVADRLKSNEQHIRDMLETPESKFFVGERGWIRPLGWVEPKK